MATCSFRNLSRISAAPWNDTRHRCALRSTSSIRYSLELGVSATSVDAPDDTSPSCAPQLGSSQRLHFSHQRPTPQSESEAASEHVANWENVQQRFTAERSNDTALLVVS